MSLGHHFNSGKLRTFTAYKLQWEKLERDSQRCVDSSVYFMNEQMDELNASNNTTHI